MKTKKIPYYLLLALLTAGASLIIGFLSFGGMFALWPVLSLSFGSLILSVAYEGEIYLQNIKGALNKLFFKREYLKHQLANEFLLNHFPSDLKDKDCPQFFRDYKAQLKQLKQFGHATLDDESQKHKARIQKTLNDMEKWFAEELFAANKDDEDQSKLTAYQIELRAWLKKNEQNEAVEKLDTRRKLYIGVQVFSAISAVFMGFGTTYLLVGVFEVIPALSFISFGMLPAAVIPMAIIAGAAYGLLAYNAITDMINNDTLRKWYYKLRDDFAQGVTVRNVFMASAAIILLIMAITLTVCTAGTWWTVVQNARPLFEWMGKIPSFVMGIINPIITGISTLIFDVQNTSETLDMIDENLNIEDNVFQRTINKIVTGFQELRARENWWQIFNPARILLLLTVTPLRIIMFFGHLISIGVTADRLPGLSEIASALLGIISEAFQDMHYFVDHDHDHDECSGHEHGSGHNHTQEMLDERLGSKHGHNHNTDLPTIILKAIFSPLYFLAGAWAAGFSKLNGQTAEDTRETLSLDDAVKQQLGFKKTMTITPDATANQTSSAWKVEQAIYRIERHKQKELNSVTYEPELAAEKAKKLSALQDNLRANSKIVSTKDQILNEVADPVYNRHRFYDNGKTKTQQFLEELPERIGVAPAA